MKDNDKENNYLSIILLMLSIAVIEVALCFFTKGASLEWYLITILGGLIACNIREINSAKFISEGKEIWICIAISILRNLFLFQIFYLPDTGDDQQMKEFSVLLMADIVVSAATGAVYHIFRVSSKRSK